jgi:hypothetical protein
MSMEDDVEKLRAEFAASDDPDRSMMLRVVDYVEAIAEGEAQYDEDKLFALLALYGVETADMCATAVMGLRQGCTVETKSPGARPGLQGRKRKAKRAAGTAALTAKRRA